MLMSCSRLPFSCQLVPRWVLTFSWVTSVLSSDSRPSNESGLLLRLGLQGAEMQTGLTSHLQCSDQAWKITNISFLLSQEGQSSSVAYGGDYQPPTQGMCRMQDKRRGTVRWWGCPSIRSEDASHEKLIFQRLSTTGSLAQQKRKDCIELRFSPGLMTPRQSIDTTLFISLGQC